MKREIGGYIQLEKNRMPMLHEDGIAVNCGRSGLSYLIRARGIKKIVVPWFMCECIRNLCKKESVEVRFYSVDTEFRPLLSQLEPDEWLYFVNYYGQFDNEAIGSYCRQYGRVIVDQAQAYFQMPIPGVDTMYTCRKFLGVADGGFLYTDAPVLTDLPRDESFDRMHFLLGRFERSASEFYQEYVQNNAFFDNEPLKQMSLLTENLLRGIDYDFIKTARTENFTYLHQRLGGRNQLTLRIPEGAFAYPLLIPHGRKIRKILLRDKIYIPTLWPNVLEDCPENSTEYKMTCDLLPLPCDQRYSVADMEYLCGKIQDAIAEIRAAELDHEEPIDISVIVLTYNHKNYIRKALDSILMQKTSYRYEVLVADDASTDGTSEIVREYAQKYPNHIRAFIREKNLGATRNSYQTLKAARGRYLATCEGDDFWTDPEKLQLQVDFLETHLSYSACVHAIRLVDINGQPTQQNKLEWYGDKQVFSLKDFRGIQLPGHVVSMVRRNYFLDPGFDDGFILGANPNIVDRTCALLWLAKGDYYHMDREMACYRYVQSGPNLTNVLYTRSSTSIEQDYAYTCKLEDYAQNVLKVDGGFYWHKRDLFIKAFANAVRYPGKGYGDLVKRIWKENRNKLWFFSGIFIRIGKKFL